MLKKSLLFFFLISLIALPAAFCAPSVSIEEMKGTVLINGQPAVVGQTINPDEKITTGNDGSASVVIEHTGSVKLSKDTTWSYDHFSEDETIDFSAYLALGRLRANVKKLPAGSVFQVKTPTSVAAVRGTSFGLFVYQFEEKVYTQLDVFESAVQFSDVSGQQAVVVEEGNSSTGNESGVVTPPQSSGMETQKALESGDAAAISEKDKKEEAEDRRNGKTDENKKAVDGNGPGGGSGRKDSGEDSLSGINSKMAASTMNDEFASADLSGDMEMGGFDNSGDSGGMGDKMDMMQSMMDTVPEAISQPATEFKQEVQGSQETKQGISADQLDTSTTSGSGGSPTDQHGGHAPLL